MFKTFFKENIELVVALALPLLLILCFAGWRAMTTLSTQPPQTDFLILTGYNDYRSPFLFNVNEDGELDVIRRYSYKDGNRTETYYNNHDLHLWRVYAEDMSVEEIALPTIQDEKPLDAPREELIEVKALSDMKLSTRMPGPDGYMFSGARNNYDGNLMLEIFGYRHSKSLSIEKDGRRIPIKGLQDIGRYNAKFIGWIEE